MRTAWGPPTHTSGAPGARPQTLEDLVTDTPDVLCGLVSATQNPWWKGGQNRGAWRPREFPFHSGTEFWVSFLSDTQGPGGTAVSPSRSGAHVQ